jgi:hypothetical protein
MSLKGAILSKQSFHPVSQVECHLGMEQVELTTGKGLVGEHEMLLQYPMMGSLPDGVDNMKGLSTGLLPGESQRMLRIMPLVSPWIFLTKGTSPQLIHVKEMESPR